MKRILWISMLCILIPIIGGLAQTSAGVSDSLTVTTTQIEKTYSTRWITVSMYFKGCTGLLRWASSDQDSTGIFTEGVAAPLKKWVELPPNTVITITANRDLGIVGLKHLAAKAKTGTGALILTGFKRSYEE